MKPLATRMEEGKALRQRLSRQNQGDWSPAPNRPDPVTILKRGVASRDPALLPLRWGRMAGGAFSFYRGNTALMAMDLRDRPTAGIETQLCGDAHALNLGTFAAPDGDLVFDLNDFDETLPGPFEWDLKRLCTSFLLAAEEAGVARSLGLDGARACAQAYRLALAEFATLPIVALARIVIRPEEGHGALQGIFEAAARDTPARLVEKAIEKQSFRSKPPALVPLPASESNPFLAAWKEYRESLGFARQSLLDRFEPKAWARRVAGCGSMGVRDVLLLAEGNGPEDPLFLEFKGQPGSAWGPSRDTHRGREVASAQQRMQTWSDPFLGWTTVAGAPFLVRQWSDHKASMEVREFGADLPGYAALCGRMLAKAHARTGDPGQLTGYLGKGEGMDAAMAAFANTYADQVLRDWEALKAAIARGDLATADF